jgi:hypothetical protein
MWIAILHSISWSATSAAAGLWNMPPAWSRWVGGEDRSSGIGFIELDLAWEAIFSFIPQVPASLALWSMHAQHPAAPGAGPFLIFAGNEIHAAVFLNKRQVLQYTRAIFGAIAFIQVSQACAGVLRAIKAILEFSAGQVFAILDPALNAGFHFDGIVPSASGTGILCPAIGHAQTTVDPAGGNQKGIG